MTSCEKCKGQLDEDALFCPKCGTRTPKGKREEAESPWEDTLAQVREQIDKAISSAMDEIHKGLQTAREEINKATSGKTVKCPHCGEMSSTDATFCWDCGKKLR